MIFLLIPKIPIKIAENEKLPIDYGQYASKGVQKQFETYPEQKDTFNPSPEIHKSTSGSTLPDDVTDSSNTGLHTAALTSHKRRSKTKHAPIVWRTVKENYEETGVLTPVLLAEKDENEGVVRYTPAYVDIPMRNGDMLPNWASSETTPIIPVSYETDAH